MTLATAVVQVLIGCIGAWGARRLLQRTHRITHRMPIRLRALETSDLLVVAPHMDDEAIGPGGTLALHRRLGSHVRIVFCAAGATPVVDAIRRAEARACGEHLGAAELTWLDLPEGELSRHEDELGRRLAEHLRAHAPKQIFVPYPTDHHRDHAATAAALAHAIRETGWRGEVWCFEVWSPCWPNTAVDIGAAVDDKRRAIECHASQTAGLHYTGGILGLNSYRALRVYVEHAEAFWVASEDAFVDLAEEMSRL